MLALLSARILASRTITGHATIQARGLGLAHRANDFLHVLSGGAWLCALMSVLMFLPQRSNQEAKRALMRFSTTGHFAVALIVATGLVNTSLIVGDIPSDWCFPD